MWPQVAGTNTLLDLPSLCLFVLYLCPWCYGCPTSFRALRKGQLSIRCPVWKKKPLIRTFETAADQWNHVNGCKPWFLWGPLHHTQTRNTGPHWIHPAMWRWFKISMVSTNPKVHGEHVCSAPGNPYVPPLCVSFRTTLQSSLLHGQGLEMARILQVIQMAHEKSKGLVRDFCCGLSSCLCPYPSFSPASLRR